MKTKTNSVFIVEGKSDRLLLSNFFDTEIVTTNGTYVSRGTIYYLKALEKHHDMIIITDPDGPGNRIAERLLEELKGVKRVFLKKEESIKKGKVGLAETDIPSLLEKVKPLLSSVKELAPKLTLEDLLAFEKYDPNYKDKIMKIYPIGKCNNKTMINRLSYLNVTVEMVRNIIYG